MEDAYSDELLAQLRRRSGFGAFANVNDFHSMSSSMGGTSLDRSETLPSKQLRDEVGRTAPHLFSEYPEYAPEVQAILETELPSVEKISKIAAEILRTDGFPFPNIKVLEKDSSRDASPSEEDPESASETLETTEIELPLVQKISEEEEAETEAERTDETSDNDIVEETHIPEEDSTLDLDTSETEVEAECLDESLDFNDEVSQHDTNEEVHAREHGLSPVEEISEKEAEAELAEESSDIKDEGRDNDIDEEMYAVDQVTPLHQHSTPEQEPTLDPELAEEENPIPGSESFVEVTTKEDLIPEPEAVLQHEPIPESNLIAEQEPHQELELIPEQDSTLASESTAEPELVLQKKLAMGSESPAEPSITPESTTVEPEATSAPAVQSESTEEPALEPESTTIEIRPTAGPAIGPESTTGEPEAIAEPEFFAEQDPELAQKPASISPSDQDSILDQGLAPASASEDSFPDEEKLILDEAFETEAEVERMEGYFDSTVEVPESPLANRVRTPDRRPAPIRTSTSDRKPTHMRTPSSARSVKSERTPNSTRSRPTPDRRRTIDTPPRPPITPKAWVSRASFAGETISSMLKKRDSNASLRSPSSASRALARTLRRILPLHHHQHAVENPFQGVLKGILHLVSADTADAANALPNPIADIIASIAGFIHRVSTDAFADPFERVDDVACAHAVERIDDHGHARADPLDHVADLADGILGEPVQDDVEDTGDDACEAGYGAGCDDAQHCACTCSAAVVDTCKVILGECKGGELKDHRARARRLRRGVWADV
ncbi:uncharacterized protein CC84DRAFT_1205391 [Paraphaeosphaeria sporulosa]|uniref:Uncharacterized protein n=1 Tax=Paraphaeosphaeria sporulosa TaxID=1460663 RepID=A0A177CDA5_9PLEO|nr:uncharacterized protein CC84DRAFT_1205391 [Paraphaeosphaeria sporulosa]OAG05634.1 hypothetical protein CC84DRAFT_1205391 [Paraphaeosphaeria sporulosa]